MRPLVILLVTACSTSPRPSAPLQASVERKVTGGAVTFTDWGVTHVDSLFFSDGGQRLVAAGYGAVVEIDPVTRKQRGVRSLSSGTLPNPRSRPGVGETLSWEVREAVWAWEAGSIVGVAQLSAWGDAPSGLSVWRPASGAPVKIPASPGSLCEPLAISHDHKAVVARVDASNRGCGPWQTGAQVYSTETQKPLGPPLEVGITTRAAFSRDGRLVAVGGAGALKVMDLREYSVVTLPLPHQLTALAFHPRTNVVAWTSTEGQLESWTIGQAKPVAHGPGQGLAFSPDGRFAATNRDGKIVVLDATTLRVTGAPLEGVRGVFTDAIAFSEDGTQLAAAISGTEIGVWQLAPRRAPPFEDGWLQRLRPLPTPAPAPFPPIHHDGRLEGRVFVGGKPVANAEVTIEAHHQEYDDARALPRLATRTAADGSYRFENAPTIVYQQLVRAPGATIGGYVFDMREKKVHNADVRLDPAVTIRGRVLGPNNAPAGGVRVLHLADYGTAELDIATDAKGRFVIDHLRPAATTYAISVRRADGAVRGMTFDLSKPGPIDATVKLAPPDDPRVVHFLVVDKAGNPIGGARIESESQGTKADANGKASIDVAPGRKGSRARVIGDDRRGISDYAGFDLPQAAPITLVVDR